MENILRVNSEKGVTDNNLNMVLENRIEALKALAGLLLREVESLEPVGVSQIHSRVSDKINLSDEVQRFEESLIRDALLRSRGHQRKAARILGTKVSTLNAKIKRFGIEPFSFTANR